MSLFNIDYSKLVNWLLPVRLRKPVVKSWLQALIAPVKYIYNLFGSNRTNNLYYLAHNSQVVYMQAALNDVFDPFPTNRRITIVDGDAISAVNIYIDAEAKPVWLYTDAETDPVWLYTDSDIANAFNGFIVQVPAGPTYDMNYMKAVIDKYRLPSKNQYKIVAI